MGFDRAQVGSELRRPESETAPGKQSHGNFRHSGSGHFLPKRSAQFAQQFQQRRRIRHQLLGIAHRQCPSTRIARSARLWFGLEQRLPRGARMAYPRRIHAHGSRWFHLPPLARAAAAEVGLPQGVANFQTGLVEGMGWQCRFERSFQRIFPHRNGLFASPDRCARRRRLPVDHRAKPSHQPHLPDLQRQGESDGQLQHLFQPAQPRRPARSFAHRWLVVWRTQSRQLGMECRALRLPTPQGETCRPRNRCGKNHGRRTFGRCTVVSLRLCQRRHRKNRAVHFALCQRSIATGDRDAVHRRRQRMGRRLKFVVRSDTTIFQRIGLGRLSRFNAAGFRECPRRRRTCCPHRGWCVDLPRNVLRLAEFPQVDRAARLDRRQSWHHHRARHADRHGDPGLRIEILQLRTAHGWRELV